MDTQYDTTPEGIREPSGPTRIERLGTQYVHEMPAVKESGILYVSYQYGLAIHLCACGCGTEAVTPLGEGEWSLDREVNGTVSLRPSILQRSCRAHYYITRSEVVWLP
jgi:hypothetical protein